MFAKNSHVPAVQREEQSAKTCQPEKCPMVHDSFSDNFTASTASSDLKKFDLPKVNISLAGLVKVDLNQQAC